MPKVRLNLTGTVKSRGGRGVGVRGGSKALSLAAEGDITFIKLNILERYTIGAPGRKQKAEY